MTSTDLLVGIAIAVGLVGIVVPVLPGDLLVLAALAGWGLATSTGAGWAFAGAAIALVLAGEVVKYVVPGRRLKSAGVPMWTLLVAGVLGVVGFFVVPVVGMVIGFVLGVFLAEWTRLRDAAGAWRSTAHALKAVGLGILIELGACLLATAVWAIGVVVT